MLLASIIMVTPAIDHMWGWTSIENALEIWFPMTVNALLVVIVGSDWLIRRRAPWVLLGGVVGWVLLEGAMSGFGATDAAQAWALGFVD